MNVPAKKLGRKKTSADTPTPTHMLESKRKPKPKPEPSSRNPLKDLNNASLPPPSHSSREGLKRGCFAFLLSGSSSSSSTNSSSKGPLHTSKPLHRTPKSAPPCSKILRPIGNHGGAPELRPQATHKNPSSRSDSENDKQRRSERQQKPTAPLALSWRKCGRSGPEGPFQKKKAAEGRGQGGAMSRPTGPNSKQEPSLDSTTGRVTPPEEGKNSPCKLSEDSKVRNSPCKLSDGCVSNVFRDSSCRMRTRDFGLEVYYGSDEPCAIQTVISATPGKEGEQQQQNRQPSQTPTSTRTATPPVQASISPELGTQSVLPTPACFAAGHHLISGVQDRRKCRPRGILNVGGCGQEVEDRRGLGSFGAPGGGIVVPLTTPSPVGASVHWLSSPRDDGSGRLSTVSSSNHKASLGVCPGEASVKWLISPLENATGGCVPSGSSALASGTIPLSDHRLWSVSSNSMIETTGISPGFGGLISLNSPNFEDTPSAVEICCSPTTNSSVSPFSMIIHKAASLGRFKDHSHQDKGRHRYGSLFENSPFSGDSHGNSNVICTPSSGSSLNEQAGSYSSFELQMMAEAVETHVSSSPACQVLSGGSSNILPLSVSSFQIGCPTPLNSTDLVWFRSPYCHRSSVKEESRTGGENLSSSKMRISWREGLVSRIFDMDEFDHDNWSLDKEDRDDLGEDKLSFRLDTKSDWNLGSSMFKEVDQKDPVNGFGSFEFVGHKHNEEQIKEKGSSPLPISCAEAVSIEVDELAASDDSDWTLFFKNHLFEL